MTTYALPTDGSVSWGDQLNAYITNVVMATLNQQVTNLADHEANSPSDPHGDRAYAQQLFRPITQNVNRAGGFVQLTNAGQIPAAVLPTPDTWHDLRPYGSAFAAATGLYPPQYRQTLDGGVRIAGYVATTSSGYNGSIAFANALPPAIWPDRPVSLPITVNASVLWVTSSVPQLTVGTTGSVVISGLPEGLAAGTVIGLYGWYPLDASYGMIEG